ncbi:curli-like amyloid fiber formation chaperone CsgH [Desulfosediminicola ganghwensis]|uniref:curli-like amyloid fiber formation chaperone CsgH n=1 Tax=Desulfosediminicola ganghwensis TaxID=2569540 RepID=UPI0010AD8F34|nr:curli-like amyloid fiber formation chaperone CsgH [Desulfosediminicola ganghwensis]
MSHLIAILLVAAQLSFAATATCGDTPHRGSLKIELVDNNILLVRGVCLSTLAGQQLQYSFTAKKSGSAGTATSSQSGYFISRQGEALELCKTRLNSQQGDLFRFSLKIYDQNGEIFVVEEKFEVL